MQVFGNLTISYALPTLNGALKALPNVPNLTRTLMDHNLTLNEYLAQNPEDATPLRCDVCGVYDEEVASCNDKVIDQICPACAEKGQMMYCDGCSSYHTLFGPSKEECQNCYERSIDQAHDRMKEF